MPSKLYVLEVWWLSYKLFVLAICLVLRLYLIENLKINFTYTSPMLTILISDFLVSNLCYCAWQLLVQEFLHALVFHGITEKPLKRFNITVMIRKQAPHGRCHTWFSEEDRERQKVSLSCLLKTCCTFPCSFKIEWLAYISLFQHILKWIYFSIIDLN